MKYFLNEFKIFLIFVFYLFYFAVINKFKFRTIFFHFFWHVSSWVILTDKMMKKNIRLYRTKKLIKLVLFECFSRTTIAYLLFLLYCHNFVFSFAASLLCFQFVFNFTTSLLCFQFPYLSMQETTTNYHFSS